jgi:hypothetical protein
VLAAPADAARHCTRCVLHADDHHAAHQPGACVRDGCGAVCHLGHWCAAPPSSMGTCCCAMPSHATHAAAPTLPTVNPAASPRRWPRPAAAGARRCSRHVCGAVHAAGLLHLSLCRLPLHLPATAAGRDPTASAAGSALEERDRVCGRMRQLPARRWQLQRHAPAAHLRQLHRTAGCAAVPLHVPGRPAQLSVVLGVPRAGVLRNARHDRAPRVLTGLL